MVVLPELSGPYISITRPLGKPPIPKATSNVKEPVETDSISLIAAVSPKRIIAPLPNCFSICPKAAANAFFLLLSI